MPPERVTDYAVIRFDDNTSQEVPLCPPHIAAPISTVRERERESRKSTINPAIANGPQLVRLVNIMKTRNPARVF